MFTADDVQKRLKQQPFAPVRIITSAGEYYDITHPELVVVGRRQLFVGKASQNNPSIFDGYSLVSLLHITALEDLPVSAGDPKNGQ